MATKTNHIYTKENDWTDFINAMSSGELCQVDKNIWYYFLEVLPPIYMNRRQDIDIDGVVLNKLCDFGFAEGKDYVTDFWKAGHCYYCKQSNRVNRCW